MVGVIRGYESFMNVLRTINVQRLVILYSVVLDQEEGIGTLQQLIHNIHILYISNLNLRCSS